MPAQDGPFRFDFRSILVDRKIDFRFALGGPFSFDFQSIIVDQRIDFPVHTWWTV